MKKCLMGILVIFLCIFTPAMAAEKGLYAIKGTGQYTNYMELKGFQKAKKFRVFYKGNYESFQVEVVDLRKLNPNQIVKWKYKGKIYKNTRKQCENFFSDTSQLTKYIPDGETLSSEWFSKTFGQVYWDWAEYLGFTSDASRMVEKYLSEKEGKECNNRFAGAIDVDKIYSDILNKEWVTADNLLLFQNDTYEKPHWGKTSYYDEKAKEYLLNHYAFYTTGIMGDCVIYPVPDMTDSFINADNSQETFSNIRMKKENGILYFYKEDLEKAGVIKK